MSMNRRDFLKAAAVGGGAILASQAMSAGASMPRELPPEAEVSQGKVFGLLVQKYDIKWKIEDRKFVVFDLESV